MTAPFSLLLPVYERDDPEHVSHAFRSAVNEQTLRPSEVVLVQDGAIPDALSATLGELCEASPVPVRRVRIERRQGLANALTIGLAACEHEIVARMDADDVSVAERFSRQMELMEQGLDIVGTGMYEFADDSSEVLGKRTPPVGHERIVQYSRFHDPFNHPTVMYRKSAVARAGGYKDLGLMEDYWLFARMIHTGARVENLPDALLLYRVGSGAYARRGGMHQFIAEMRLQRLMRKIGFTTTAQLVRNVAVRGTYRFVPVGLRKLLYRAIIVRGFKQSR